MGHFYPELQSSERRFWSHSAVWFFNDYYCKGRTICTLSRNMDSFPASLPQHNGKKVSPITPPPQIIAFALHLKFWLTYNFSMTCCVMSHAKMPQISSCIDESCHYEVVINHSKLFIQNTMTQFMAFWGDIICWGRYWKRTGTWKNENILRNEIIAGQLIGHAS